MTELDPKVLDGEPNGSVTEPKPVTPATQGVATAATPEQPSPDAEVARLRQEYEAKLKTYENDLRQTKSTLQSQLAKSQNDWKQKERQLKDEMERLRIGGMDEDQRKAYEATRSQTLLGEYQTQLQELEQAKQEAEAMLAANNYFLSEGVPASELITDQGYEALYNSGMGWISAENKRLREALKTAPAVPPTQPKTPPVAPPVDTSTGVPPTGPTWADLRAKYGSDEAVYALIEQRRLSPDILPK